MEQLERSDSLINNRQGTGGTAVMPDLEDSHKENEEKTPYRDRVNGFKEQPKRSHRKSASPSHIGDSHKVAKTAQGIHRREPDVKFVGDREHPEKNETDVVNKVRIVNRDEDLLTFAEILYKCSLCTTLPCILTSQGAFLRHVKEHHVAKQTAGNQCPQCYLHFQTHTDLQAHLTEAHSGPELDNAAALSGVSSRTSPQLTELERPTSPRPPDCGDGSDKREVEGKKNTDDQSDGDDLTQPTEGQNNNKQNSVEDSGEVDVKPQISGLRASTSTPLATLQYHSSAQSPQRLHVLSAVSPLSPPHHPQQVDPRHSPLWGGGCPQETFNGFPNFTPEFGRYTKLIREGGRIVYFCQVCNVKCQVKAAFQVHCNGMRHHNTVNMVGKNKGHVTPPHAAREACLRSPLKEVPVMAPQLTALRPDHSLVEKMNKFFRDHPDMSAILNHGGGQAAGDVWGFPMNFSLKDQPGGQSDSEESTKQSETDGRCSEKRHPHYKDSCREKVRTSPAYPPGSSLKRESDEQCVVNCRQRLEHENFSVWTVPNHSDSGACDLTCEKGRKRPAPSTPVTESLTVSENSSASLSRTSSSSPAKSDGKKTHQDTGDTSLNLPCCDSSSGPSGNKRARLHTPHVRSGHGEAWEPSAPRCRDVPLVTNGDLDDTQSTASCPDQPHKQHAGSPRQPDKDVGEFTHNHHHPGQREERRWSESDQDKENLSDVDSVDGTRPSDDHSPSGGDTSLQHPVSALHSRQQSRSKSDDSSDVGTGSEQARDSRVLESATKQESGADSSTSVQNKHGLAEQERRTAPGAAEVTVKQQRGGADSPGSSPSQCTLSPAPDHSVLGMLVKQSFTLDRGPCFFPGVVLDDWGRPDMTKDSDRPLWAAAGGLGLHEVDDVTDSGKGQSNSEGWKVTKIRDVLRGLIAASGKGSSVSRDVLLYRVSCVLQTPDVQHWGPACNRAVRDLFPHCLAQRKGKFKKTYFFGLSLIPALEDTKGENHVHVDGTSFRPLRDMTQDLEQLLEHLPGLLYWSGEVDRGVSRDAVLHVLAARLAEGEVFHWGMQCNKALRMLFPHVLMKRKGKYKTTVYFGVDFTLTAQKLLPTLKLSPEQIPPWTDQGIGVN